MGICGTIRGQVEAAGFDKCLGNRADGKVKFFFWFLLQNRNWTADCLRARGWPHDDSCCLCSQQLETANHLALLCPFVKEVRDLFLGPHPRMVQVMQESQSIGDWWSNVRGGACVGLDNLYIYEVVSRKTDIS